MQKSLFFSLILAALLSGCGGDSNSSAAVASNPQPSKAPINVSVPADAQVSDYSCVLEEVFVLGGVEQTARIEYQGVARDWKDAAGVSHSIGEESDYAYYSRSRTEKLGENRRKAYISNDIYQLVNNVWEKESHEIIRTSETIDGVRRVVENIEDGVMKPYFWESTFTEESDKVMVTVRRHTRPEVKNKNGKEFKKITETCRDTSRN